MKRVVTGRLEDRNLQESVGPAGISAVNSRCVAARQISIAVDDIRTISGRGVLRCCNCGLPVTEEMKLALRDPHDPMIASDTKGESLVSRDYVRVPLRMDDLPTNGSAMAEYSDYVACTAPCALRFMYDSPDFVQSHVPHLFAMMMWRRHRIDEPVNAAPSPEALAYLYKTKSCGDQKTLHKEVGPTKSCGDQKTFHKEVGPTKSCGDQKTFHKEVGLSASSFYWLLSSANLIGYVQSAPLYIPPMEEEQAALTEKDHRFTQYYFYDASAGPPQKGARLPPHLPSSGIKLDANPDADTETDFALDSVHPPFTPPKPNQ